MQMFNAVVKTDNTQAPWFHMTFLAKDGRAARRMAWNYMKVRIGHFKVESVEVWAEMPDPTFGPVRGKWSRSHY